MVNLQELFTVADIVSLVVFGVGEDHQHAIGGEVVHLAPEARTDEEALGGRVENDALFTVAIEEAQPDGAGHADAELAKLPVRVEAAADTRLGAVDPVDTADGERERSAELGDGKSAARVAALRDVDELDERTGHQILFATRALR